jgi:hypothetical protein
MSIAARGEIALWRAAMIAFVVAALAGVVFRGVLAWGWDPGVSLTNLRHAHSHLMFFGWVTPAVMILIGARLPELTGRARPRALGPVIAATIALGFASFPLFAAFGYTKVALFGAELPPSVIIAGLHMIAWYTFAAVYTRATWGVRRSTPLFAWDLAIGLLILSSLSAWALALVRPLGFDAASVSPLLTHAFLDTFAEGWLPLAIIGLLHAERPCARDRRPALVLLALTAPLAFGLAAPAQLVPPSLRVIAMGAGVVWGLALLAQLALFARARDLRVRVPLAMGVAVALARIVGSVAAEVIDLEGLRLLYLHTLLFGVVTLALFGLAREALGARAVSMVPALQLAALAVIASLITFSSVWPRAWSSAAAGEIAALVAFAPVIAVLASLARCAWRRTIGARRDELPAHTFLR